MFCKLIGLLPLFLLLLLFAASGGRLDAGTQAEVLVRPNLADWRCHTGDDLRWAQPDWDDHDWAPCSLNSRPSLGLFWGRLHVRLPESAAATRWSVGTILLSTSVLYANGQEIASSGRIGVNSRSSMPVYQI